MCVLEASGFEVKSILKGSAVNQDGDHIIAVSYKIKSYFSHLFRYFQFPCLCMQSTVVLMVLTNVFTFFY